MGRYEFLTTWCLDAPIDRVWERICDVTHYPDWWHGVLAVDLSVPADELGVGKATSFSWRGVLPYTLRFDLVVTRVEPPHTIDADVSGGLEGHGTWRLYAGAGTAVVYDWRVRTTVAWMNVLGPLARPALAWNHDRVMRRGGVGLARSLGATLLAHN